MQNSVWSEQHEVRSWDMDPGGRLAPLALCQYFQEAAGNHAHHLGWGVPGLRDRGLTWVLGRFRVRILRWPLWREPFTVQTWPSCLKDFQAFRDFQMTDALGDPFAVAVSTWLMLDIRRKRPVRVGDYLKDMIVSSRPRALEEQKETFPSLKEAREVSRFPVRWSEVDINQHVNNVCYVGWALDCVPVEVLSARTLSDLEIQYRAEALMGDEIIVERMTLPEEEAAFGHRIRRGSDGKDLAWVRTSWR